MKSAEDKIRMLNGILAGKSYDAADAFRQAGAAIDFVFSNGHEINSLGGFAREIMKFYDPDTHLEFIDLGDDYFDPLFKIDEIRDAAKRLAGSEKPVLVVAGLDRATLKARKKWSAKRREEYFSNLDIVEAHVLRYESSIPEIEIIFV